MLHIYSRDKFIRWLNTSDISTNRFRSNRILHRVLESKIMWVLVCRVSPLQSQQHIYFGFSEFVHLFIWFGQVFHTFFFSIFFPLPQKVYLTFGDKIHTTKRGVSTNCRGPRLPAKWRVSEVVLILVGEIVCDYLFVHSESASKRDTPSGSDCNWFFFKIKSDWLQKSGKWYPPFLSNGMACS